MSATPPSRPIRPMLLAGTGIVGGMEQSLVYLTRELRARGCRPVVGVPIDGPFTARLLADGHPPDDVFVVDMGPDIRVGAIARCVEVARARGIDLIHSHLVPADVLGAAAARVAGIPCLVTLHGILHYEEQRLLQPLFGARYVAVCDAGREAALAQGFAPEAVRCVPLGIDAAAFARVAPGDRRALRRELGVADGEVLVTSVTRLAPEKTPEVLLRVVERLAREDARLVFAVAGTGPLDEVVREQAVLMHLGGRLRLLGNRDDVASLLAASDVSILCSRLEGIPLALLESMAAGVPVVAHNVGGVAEAIDPASGFLIPFGDVDAFTAAVLRLARDPALRRRMGESGRAHCLEEFGIEKAADRLLTVYADAVESGGTEARANAFDERQATHAAARPHGDIPFSAARPSVDGAAIANGAHDGTVVIAARAPVVDAHLHLAGEETCRDVLRSLDDAGIECACLIGPFLDKRTWQPVSGAALRRSNDFLLNLASQAPERLWALVTVDPLVDSASHELRSYAALGCVRGLKLVPHGWRPEDPELADIYETCAAARLPILFHSGIFISGRASNACRPAAFEAVRRHPELTVVLAHMGWPWTDEAIAVALMDPLRGARHQILLDISPGTPPVYRSEALRRAFAVLGSEMLLFGSDRFFPIAGSVLREMLDADVAALRDAGAGEGDLARIFGGNAARVFAPRATAAVRVVPTRAATPP